MADTHDGDSRTPGSAHQRPFAYAITLIVAGIVGWIAAFSLTVEKFALLADPTASLGCDYSILVQCRANLDSWQGSLFGFPNPILGLTGWVAPIVVGMALLAGARFDRWFRILFTIGVTAALALVIFLITTSIFELGTLCPWCMVTWVAAIPTFWMVVLGSLRDGTIPLPTRATAVFSSLYGWVPAITVLSYLAVAVIAQLRLDVLGSL